ncbi:condensation domain-containing protein [Pseudoalteromonas sp. B160]
MDNVAIKTLLAELDAQGIFVYLQDGRLKLRSKLTTVPAPELAKIKACKDELIAYMQRHHLQQGDLSSAQQRIWFIDQYEQQSTAYNMCGLLQLSDSLTINELQRAFDTLLARHQILTTQFFNTDQGVVQRVNSQLRLALNALEIARHETPTQIVEKLHDELSYRFDLENDLLIRATLIGHSGEGKWLYIAMHHIIADGWSVRLLVQELLAILTNNNNTVNNAAACKPLQYLDYVHWQGQFKQSPIYQQQLSYWQQALTGMELFELPTSYPRDKQKTYQGKSQHSVIDTRLVTEFDSCCQQLSATRFVGLLSVFYVLLQRYSQKQDITVAVPVLNREQPEFENVIGCFINTLPMRKMVSPQSSFAQLIAQTKVLVAQGLANQSVAVEDIIETLGLAKSSAHSALFQILFNYNGVDTGTVETATLSAKLLPLDNGTAKFDLTLNVSESEQGLDISFDYCSALFDDHVIQQMSNDFNELVISLGNNAAQTIATVELPSACYASQLLGRKKDHEKVSSDVIALPVQVIKQAELSAEKTACIEADQHGKTARSLSYQQLVQQSAALASHILALQTHHQQTTAAPIALLVSRSIDALLTMFALLQTGRAYLPIEQGTPVARIAEILQQAGCEYLVTFDDTALEKQAVTVLNEQHITLWPFAQLSKAAVNLTGLPNLNLNDSAYVIFTSGSTGAPKGVEISHAALAHYVQSITKRLELNNDTKSAVVTGLATDLCLTGIYPVWASGGTVVLISPHVKSDPVAIVDTFSEQAINFLKITPSFAAELLATIAASQVPRAPLQQWVLGGNH